MMLLLLPKPVSLLTESESGHRSQPVWAEAARGTPHNRLLSLPTVPRILPQQVWDWAEQQMCSGAGKPHCFPRMNREWLDLECTRPHWPVSWGRAGTTGTHSGHSEGQGLRLQPWDDLQVSRHK